MRFASLRSAVLLAALVLPALAQTGVVDQVSPFPGSAQTAGFNGSASSLIWQQEVQAGMTGQLEGFELLLNGAVNSTIDVRVKLGGGWNTGTPVFQTTVVQLSGGFPSVAWVDVTSASINVAPGTLFVIELQGNDDNCGFVGTYAPPPGAPQYPNWLFLNGPGCFVDCGWRAAFTSYVIPPPSGPVPYCTAGTSTNGCNASITASANPNVSHTAPCTINVANVEGQKSGIIFYALAQGTPQPWCSLGGGSSFLCVKPPTMRTTSQGSGGTANACNGQLSLDWNAFQLANPGALGNPWTAGAKAFVQGWFRDPPSCKTTSLSNAVELTYLP